MRYFILKNKETLEVVLSLDMDEQPANSLPFEATDLVNPRFDQYPNPTVLIEGEPLPIEVPQVITRRQFKIALAVLGKNEQDILNGINQLPEPTRTIALISYTEAGTFERNNPELIFVGKTFLQMTDEQIDEIFIIGNHY
jgi:hypothetical protein